MGIDGIPHSGNLAKMPVHRFRSTHWYEHGQLLPKPISQLRVSSAKAVTHPTWGRRDELRDNGLALINLDLLPASLQGAELYCELWCGHPGTANHRVTINGRSTYALCPDHDPTAKAVAHGYPTIPLELTDLCRGVNALQFACEEHDTFWGHFLLEGLCLRGILPADHEQALPGFEASVATATCGRTVRLRLDASDPDRIERVDYHARYSGFASNGGPVDGWHGFSLGGIPVGIVGSATTPPFDLDWDISMLPDQPSIDVKAIVHLGNGLSYETPALTLADLPGRNVSMHGVTDGEPSLWVRDGAGERQITLPDDMTDVERATLSFCVWDGGSEHDGPPYELNGRPLPLDADARHRSRLMTCELDPAVLRPGENQFRVIAPTHHHGLEILRPGPVIFLRRSR
jgi:hypothetical protein